MTRHHFSYTSARIRLCTVTLVITILLAALPMTTAIARSEAYPTFQYDAERTGNASGNAPNTATVLWQSSEMTAGCVEAGPIVYGGNVYISTWWSAGMGVTGNAVDALYCLDTESGDEIWNNPNVYGASTTAVADNKLFVGTHRGEILCVDAANGEILWSKQIAENPGWYGVTSSPLVVDDTVYVVSYSDGTLHAFSFDGSERWAFATGGNIFCYSSPAAYGETIFFAGNSSGEHALFCVNMRTHKEVWHFTTETEIRGSPTIWPEENLVFFTTKYVPSKKYGIYAVSITTGEEVWNVSHYSSWASTALSNGKLFIGGSNADTTFYCYNANDGSLRWKNEKMGGAIDSSPVVVDGKVYFGTNEVDGTVYALNANNGLELWHYTPQLPQQFNGAVNIASHPAIADGTLFIGVDNLGVLAFRDPVIRTEEGINRTSSSSVSGNNASASFLMNATTDTGVVNTTENEDIIPAHNTGKEPLFTRFVRIVKELLNGITGKLTAAELLTQILVG